ncbi:MAG: hypothetical protein HGA85_01920 [Nanoarchaeota archaeon]|nr:hypothetical protein [Nanoarchaeota archaeon]
MRNAIITACNKRYGEFLIRCWLKSLLAKTDTTNISIIVLDYGLTNDQVKALRYNNITVVKERKDGAIVTIRLRDTAKLLKREKFGKVLLCDGGDILFQEDISPIFERSDTQVAGVADDYYVAFERRFPASTFSVPYSQIKKVMRNKKSVNAGFLTGPSEKMAWICETAYSMIKNKKIYGPDQVVIPFLLYSYGFRKLNRTYNFIPAMSKKRFYIENSEFYFMNKKKIKVVHNTGGISAFRIIKKFGYGPGCNMLDTINYAIQKNIYRGLDLIYSRKLDIISK